MSETEERIKPIALSYNQIHLKSKLADCISRRVSPDIWQWVAEKASLINSDENVQNLMVAFAATTRKTGKQPILLTEQENIEIQSIRPHLTIQNWPIDRLCRVWLLMNLNVADQNKYIRTIECLFPTAEMNEQVALYSALPVLAYPTAWRARCAEGIRSNIADVLESIMCNNPYPSENLDEAAWNQLVLKAIFTEKPIHQIINMDERANEKLASTLCDYAHERWAAHRTVPPLLWWCVGRFINEKNFPDIMRLAFSLDTTDREAAALACMQSTYIPAHELIQNNRELHDIVKSDMTWINLAKKLERNS